MWEAIGGLLSPAIGVALSPLSMAGIILMLLSPRALTIAPAFLLGWAAAIVLTLGAIVGFVPPDSLNEAGGDPSTLSVVVNLGFGALLIFLAFRQWRSRPKPGDEPEMPRWMQSVDRMSVPAAIGVGAFFSGLNAKNLVFNIAAGVSIARADLPAGEAIGAIAIYLLVASLSVALPMLWYLRDRTAAEVTLGEMKEWLIRNNATVMTVIFLLLGVSFLGTGLGGL